MKYKLPIILAACAGSAVYAQMAIIRPVRITPINLRAVDLSKQVKAPPARWTINPNLLKMAPYVTATKIAGLIQTSMAGKSVGFAVTVMMPGGATASATGGMARSAPDANTRGWTENDRINIASVSKTLTAAAVVKAAADKGISLDTEAWTLLPDTWTYSTSFKAITIREMLTHNSGIRTCGPYNSDLKTCAAAEVKAADKDHNIWIWTRYNNANLAFMRYILPRIVDGKSPSDTIAGPRYWAIMNGMIIKPAGLGGADCSAPSNPALSYVGTKDNLVWNDTAAANYDFTTLKPGHDWGDDTPTCGSEGWNLSSKQLATFANALFVTYKLLPAETVGVMQTEGQGMMYSDFGGGLTAYGHGGYFPPNNGGELRAQILTFNNGISVGMLVNSRYNGDYNADMAEAVRAGVK